MGRLLMHVMLFKWKSEATMQQVEECLDALRRMKNEIPLVLDMVVGKQDSNIHAGYEDWSKGFTHLMQVTLATGDDLMEFRDHPMHKRCVAKFLMPIVKDMLAFDCYDTTASNSKGRKNRRREGDEGPHLAKSILSGALSLAVGALLGTTLSSRKQAE